MTKAIEIKDLNLRLISKDPRDQDFELKNINLDIPQGTIVGLIGKNGAGKTTLIRAIMNAVKADQGTIKVFGVNNKIKNFAKVKENIGLGLTDLPFSGKNNIYELDEFYSKVYKYWDRSFFLDLARELKIPASKQVKEYSTGMKKSLSLALGLGNKPDLLIFDEITANLDPFARDKILDIIYDYSRDPKKTVLISSHILSDLEKICDYIIYLDKGQVKLFEEKDRLMEKYVLIKVGKETYEKIDKGKIISEKKSPYAYELLMERKDLPQGIDPEFISLDDLFIRLFGGSNENKGN
ncbi:ABC transporter ATP-binding protein [Neofamilia massiliensis]|uniref:ABC transporter ATP-binding protein n=1 Tax=Neofamilia massiliensis TaxID=1673724 RepID=UPI0006BB803C|nr:ABC transporter ATP-binding protein [Neofamilia massiliensis]